jgi:hypothetical protein
MLKKLFFFSALCICIGGKSQTLTVGQVYDYNPGDVFQYLETRYHNVGMCGNAETPYYYTDSVISKTYSVANDTVFYTIKHRMYAPYDCFPNNPSPIYSSGIMKVFYTNLNSIVSSVALNTCQQKDTSYVSSKYCGKKLVQSTYKRREGLDTNCTYTSNWVTQSIEGCGSYSSSTSGNVIGYWHFTTELTYYKKSGKTCGIYNTTSIKEEKNEMAVSLFPNPFSEKIELKINANQIKQVEVTDIVGRLVFASKGGTEAISINLADQPSGIYLVKIVDTQGNVSVKRAIKE